MQIMLPSNNMRIFYVAINVTIQQTGCSVLLCARQFRTQDYLAILREIAPELADAPSDSAAPLNVARLPSLKHVVVTSGNSREPYALSDFFLE